MKIKGTNALDRKFKGGENGFSTNHNVCISSHRRFTYYITVYGAVVKKRDLILTGLFYYSFLPIIGETMMYLATKGTYHILFIALFLIQMSSHQSKAFHLIQTIRH